MTIRLEKASSRRIQNVVLQIILGLLVVRYGRMLVKLPDLASSSTDVGEHHSFLPPSDMPIRKWAYAFLIAGVDPRKEGYHGFFYNVLISAELLKKTQADVIVMVQMAKNTADRLTDEEERQLKIQNVKIVYLELPPHQNFYTIQFEKFRILDFTEYSRVIFLDGDVFTFCPMDYLFELSEPLKGEPLLKQNLVLSYSAEPAHGGFFMLQPKKGDYQLLKDIILKQEKKVIESGKPFDNVTGWGHVIKPPDRWRGLMRVRNGTLWSWHGDFADQGLLYYWTKYFKKSVSIQWKTEIENWGEKDGEAYLEETIVGDPLRPYACTPNFGDKTKGHYKSNRYAGKWVPHCDFRHFVGSDKPWRQASRKEHPDMSVESIDQMKSSHQYWFFLYRKLQKKLNLTHDAKTLSTGMANMGGYPKEEHMLESYTAKIKNQGL